MWNDDDVRRVFAFFGDIRAALADEKTLAECRDLLATEAKHASESFGKIFDGALAPLAK